MLSSTACERGTNPAPKAPWINRKSPSVASTGSWRSSSWSILVAKRDADDTLHYQRLDLVLDECVSAQRRGATHKLRPAAARRRRPEQAAFTTPISSAARQGRC